MKIVRAKSTQLVDIFLLRSFIVLAYLRNNYMFRPFPGHHQPDDGLEKGPKHVVPKIRYVNIAPLAIKYPQVVMYC